MKTLKGIGMLVVIISFIAAQGFSQNAPTTAGTTKAANSQTAVKTAPGTFVDNNKDGICDNHQAKMVNGKCANWVDKNGDGVCDNCKGNCQGKGNCKGCGMGCQKGQGTGQGNCGKAGNGCQYRHGMGCQKTTVPEPEKAKDKN